MTTPFPNLARHRVLNSPRAIRSRCPVLLGLWIFVVALSTAPAQGLDAPSRLLWTTSRLAGSPEPPSPYVTEKVFPRLVLKSPIYVAPEPGTDFLIVLDRADGEPAPWQLRRFRNAPEVERFEPVLTLTNRQIYGFTFHPRYTENGFFYVFHNGPSSEQAKTNRISRFTMARQGSARPDPASEQVVIEWPSGGHDGGDLAFGKDGMLYITSGDGTSDSDTWDSGQDMTRLLAKLLRIDVDHPAPGKSYSVPRDNPFVDMPGARPETWAYGFRNPWRMGIDARTGDIWVGQNGQDLWESACLVERGANYGWSVYEGRHPFHPNRRRGPTPILPPIIEHSHADFRSLTGGVVYYGEELPELNGAYVYGDYSTGKIWGARHREGKLVWHQELVDSSLQITAFRLDARGRLLVVDYAGGIHRLMPRPKAAVTPPPFPTKLSETGLFVSTREHRVAPGILPYEVNAPGWADGARAERFIALPGTNQIAYAATRGWNLSNGSVLVQTLSMETAGVEKVERRVETRVMLRDDGEWTGYTFRWNDDQSDAFLVGKEGADVELQVREKEGAFRKQAWRIPSRAECMTCHARAVNYVLGLSLLQMNRPTGTDRSGENQLAALTRLGVLSGGPSEKPETLGRLVHPHDESAQVADRARSYLHANCSVCHVEAGGGNARMQLEYTRAADQMELVSARPQHDTFGVANAMLVAPGDPDRSVLVHRVSRRGAGQMPPLVTSRVDEQAVALFRRWIQGLPPDARFVREWTTGELAPALGGLSSGRSVEKGKLHFEKVGCAQCHRFGGVGGAVGPDLAGVGLRMDRRTLLESILEPSKVIAEEYATYEIATRDGEAVSGRVERETPEALFVRTGSAVESLVTVPKSDIRGRTRSSLSNMPSGMVNVLEKDQILDLLAYLLSEEQASKPSGTR